jgi:hypothetical protein
LAFQPALAVMDYAWARLVDGSRGRSGLGMTLLTGDPIRIISDCGSDLSSIQADDWPDMTGHHRYYGRAA